MRPLKPADMVRGQYAGYRQEDDVAKNSDVETYCALRLFIDSWRWDGVPWYLRSGKYLPDTATEVLVELKPPPQSSLRTQRQPRAKGIIFASGSLPTRRSARRSRQACGRGVYRRTAGALFAGRTAGRRIALRAAFGRRHEGRRGIVYARGRGGSRMDGGRPGSQAPSPRSLILTSAGTWGPIETG
jgi:hypothetical protein